MDQLQSKTLDQVLSYPDKSVACPICQQEFWGYSEIIFCSCGWTFIREEEKAGANLQTKRDMGLTKDELKFRRLRRGRKSVSEVK